MDPRRQRTRVCSLCCLLSCHQNTLNLCNSLPFTFEASANWSCGLEPPFAIVNSETDSTGSGSRAPTVYSLACVHKDNAFCLLHNSSIIQSKPPVTDMDECSDSV